MKRIAWCVFVLTMLMAGVAWGQVATGSPAFGSLAGGGFDSINEGNLNVSFQIPILHKAGVGIPFEYSLTYNSSIWTPIVYGGGYRIWSRSPDWGWMPVWTGSRVGYITYGEYFAFCGPLYEGIPQDPSWFQFERSGVVYHDPSGTEHSFPYFSTLDCGGNRSESTFPLTATDSSGFTLIGLGAVKTPDGFTAYPPVTNVLPNTPQPIALADLNGNTVSSANTSDGKLTFTDTLGKAVLKVAESSAHASDTTIEYTAPGGTAVYRIKHAPYNIRTNFQCSSVLDVADTNVPLVSEIDLPDIGTYPNSKYTFTYEDSGDPSYPNYVTGRLKSVTFPTGGSVTYDYTGPNRGIVCADGSAAGLTRTMSDGGQTTYSRSGGGSSWTTTVSNPATVSSPDATSTTIKFVKDSATKNPTNNLYEVWRQVNGGKLTVATCYNGNGDGTNCDTQPVQSPILRRDVYRQYDGGPQALSETTYDDKGQLRHDREYDYGGTTPVSDTETTWASIQGHPSSVVVKDGGGNEKARTEYVYDAAGNVTSTKTAANASTTLYRAFTYNTNGTLNTSIGPSTAPSPAGPTTTYVYDAATSCGGAFPTSVAEPGGLTRSMTWNCDGGVMLTATDENGPDNGQNEIYTYTDPYYWRPSATKDRANITTNLSYNPATASTPANTRSWMTFNGDQSTVEVLTSTDALGRPYLKQRRQGPSASSYDSAQTTYDNAGRTYQVSMPYSAAAGGTTTSGPWGSTASYDSLSRPSTVTDGGGGSATYSYTKNDVLITVGSRSRQLEYDALGRLKSVCEITSASGSGPCGQAVAATGYLTSYGYDTLGNLTDVTQNAQSTPQQHRTYAYDRLGRLTSEANPESGTANYFYDGPTTHCPSSTSAGDLIETNDAAGNITCYYYDSSHRVTDSGNLGPVCRRFRYDTSVSPPGGISVANTKGRLLEAFTDNCQGGPKITDLWFSYSARGEVTDVWQSTLHSGGYYHLNATYWAHGAIKGLSGLPGLPNLNYGAADGSGLDGEGRITKLTASSGQNPVTNVSYNTAGQVASPGTNLPAVTFGSGDSDLYTYDPNTGRLTYFQSNVGTLPQMLFGTLGWNADGSLQSLVLGDSCTPSAQSCSYGHDDLSRISSVSCESGAVWGQLFSYDSFGNITKTVPTGATGRSYSPTGYNATTNQPNGLGYTYDPNGNLTADGAHTYAWDVNWGNMASVDSGVVTLTYDALGRMVEQNKGGAYTQIVYSPAGGKLALMNGQSLQKGFVPLPGGGTAVYNSSGLAYYRHPDHLGSSRLASTWDRKIYAYSGYAPFGENYGHAAGKQPTDPTDLSFTGQNQDTVDGMYDFMFRQYNPVQGRWLSPDPAGLAAVDPTNPQTWNRYAYVGNSPLDTVDPLGLNHIERRGGCTYYYYLTDNEADFLSEELLGCDPESGLGPLGPSGPGGGSTGGVGTPKPRVHNSTFCNDAHAVNFVQSYRDYAAQVADQLKVPTEFILGLSARESGYGGNRFAVDYNAFFSLQTAVKAGSGPPQTLFPFSDGWQPSTQTKWVGGVELQPYMATYPSYLASAQGFAARYGSAVRGETNASRFLLKLQKAGFNGSPKFLNPNVIEATKQRMKCP